MGKNDLANSFRPNAGVVVIDTEQRVLAFRRTGTESWQLPQGGIDPGESPLEAMWRELEEETGIEQSMATLVAEVPEWLGYEIPIEFRQASSKLSRGQVQKWFVVSIDPAQLAAVEERLGELPPEEFDAWKWTTLPELADETIAFRQPIYKRLCSLLSELS